MEVAILNGNERGVRDSKATVAPRCGSPLRCGPRSRRGASRTVRLTRDTPTHVRLLRDRHPLPFAPLDW